MKLERFIIVGENIHCTRILKVGGNVVKPDGQGGHAIMFRAGSEERSLPIPAPFLSGADWDAGRVKHCAVAIWQGMRGEGAARRAGVDYLQSLARKQQDAGASYLDINVDEFTTDADERAAAMKWTAAVIQQASTVPLSIDSSNTRIIVAGLESCDPARGRPMVNSVSLERLDAVRVAAEHHAVVIASAAGEKGLPSTLEERMANIDRLLSLPEAASFSRGALHVDPLVFPISTDGANGKGFLDAVASVRKKYGPEIHIVAGLSNVSFGMPNRKLINQVFSWLAVEAGADGGIVDPSQINLGVLKALDPASEGFRLAKALLLGEDEFGMEYIAASRDGRI